MINIKYLECVITNSTWWNYASDQIALKDQSRILHEISSVLLSYINSGNSKLIIKFEYKVAYFGDESECGFFCDVLAEDFYRESIYAFCASNKSKDENFQILLASSILYVSPSKMAKIIAEIRRDTIYLQLTHIFGSTCPFQSSL